MQVEEEGKREKKGKKKERKGMDLTCNAGFPEGHKYTSIDFRIDLSDGVLSSLSSVVPSERPPPLAGVQ